MAEALPLLQEEKMEREYPMIPHLLRSRSKPLKAVHRSFISAIDTPKGRRPQAIAHRGYRAAFPENTMAAFKGAVKVGTHAIETDIHLTKDDVVVLSHVRT
jgi:glycerophosphoryl diester phosphodiesterase